MIDARIISGRGDKQAAWVNTSGFVGFVEQAAPPYGGKQLMRVFRQHLTNDGLPTDGSNQNMRVNGSSTTQDFYIGSHLDRDRYICSLSFVIADASQTLNEFGNLNASLTNGCRLFYADESGEVDIHEALKTNFQFVRLAGGQPAFGDAAGAFLANNVTGSSEGYIPTLNLREMFGFRWGIRISYGSSQRITLRVRDDLTGVDLFDCVAFGFERMPD